MRIHVKYFAPFREKTGKKEEFLEGDFRNVQELMQYLQEKYGIKTDFLMVAVNRAVVSKEKELSEKDEVAVFPPVSGG
ncbi:MAG: molybdopterin converting factor subunit 1 [Theionarchaea archaeon]|nr:molybdopterin converting factor subunit 1 [Theionarchaea archaeon]